MPELSDGSKGAIGIMAGILTLPWSTIAFILAIILNLHYIAGWWWDRSLRDFMIRKGWYKPKKKKYKIVKIEENSDLGELR